MPKVFVKGGGYLRVGGKEISLYAKKLRYRTYYQVPRIVTGEGDFSLHLFSFLCEDVLNGPRLARKPIVNGVYGWATPIGGVKGDSMNKKTSTPTTEDMAYCVKCKESRKVSDNAETSEKAGVGLVGKRHALVGWCPTCGTKMVRFLSSKSPLVEAYNQVVGKKNGKKISIERTGEPFDNPKKGGKESVTGKSDTPVGATFPLRIFATYKEKSYKAVMKSLEEVVFNKAKFSSLSTAAAAVTGGARVNGWKFWKFKDGENEYYVDAIRSDEQRVKHSKGGGGNKDVLPKYSDVEPITPPRELPRYAATFVNPVKFEKYGQVVAYLYVEKTLTRATYKKDGKVVPNSVQEFGEAISWKECFPVIRADAAEKGLVRVRVTK